MYIFWFQQYPRSPCSIISGITYTLNTYLINEAINLGPLEGFTRMPNLRVSRAVSYGYIVGKSDPYPNLHSPVPARQF